jgi:hypothetical protein
MQKFTIRRKEKFTHYNTPLFSVSTTKGKKQERFIVVFTNSDDAVAVFLSRSEVANILKRKFKNHVDRRSAKA